jgi:hypothetical protein
MQSLSDPNRVNISDKTYARVKDFFCCERRGNVRTKDDKDVETYLVNGLAPALLAGVREIPPPAFRRRYRIYFQKEPDHFPASLAEAHRAAAGGRHTAEELLSTGGAAPLCASSSEAHRAATGGRHTAEELLSTDGTAPLCASSSNVEIPRS